MPLGTEVDLGPGHIVLHGDPAPSLTTLHNATQYRTVLIIFPVILQTIIIAQTEGRGGLETEGRGSC